MSFVWLDWLPGWLARSAWLLVLATGMWKEFVKVRLFRTGAHHSTYSFTEVRNGPVSRPDINDKSSKFPPRPFSFTFHPYVPASTSMPSIPRLIYQISYLLIGACLHLHLRCLPHSQNLTLCPSSQQRLHSDHPSLPHHPM